jgi:hypothetical protein
MQGLPNDINLDFSKPSNAQKRINSYFNGVLRRLVHIHTLEFKQGLKSKISHQIMLKDSNEELIKKVVKYLSLFNKDVLNTRNNINPSTSNIKGKDYSYFSFSVISKNLFSFLEKLDCSTSDINKRNIFKGSDKDNFSDDLRGMITISGNCHNQLDQVVYDDYTRIFVQKQLNLWGFNTQYEIDLLHLISKKTGLDYRGDYQNFCFRGKNVFSLRDYLFEDEKFIVENGIYDKKIHDELFRTTNPLDDYYVDDTLAKMGMGYSQFNSARKFIPKKGWSKYLMVVNPLTRISYKLNVGNPQEWLSKSLDTPSEHI